VNASGDVFAYVAATEGISGKNPYFVQQYDGSYKIGLIRGAYHLARPDRSSGNIQADFFIANGGNWSADGRTLPGALYLDYNPFSEGCYRLSPKEMVTWIQNFSDQYRARNQRYPVICSAPDWWIRCAGNSTAFSEYNPLWIVEYD
jgi:GH25 family lysozyme M1 (1,4-beta-N-acetylmuramidase)